jgi:hypothetical protein
MNHQKLIAYWGPDNEADYQSPHEVLWEDGSQATVEDYRRNQLATRTTQATDKGNATVLLLGVDSITRFNALKNHWVVEASNGG